MMIATDKLRGKMAEKGYTQSSLASELGIHRQSFYNKMKKGIFTSTEIEAMMRILDIQDPREIFFPNSVAQ